MGGKIWDYKSGGWDWTQHHPSVGASVEKLGCVFPKESQILYPHISCKRWSAWASPGVWLVSSSLDVMMTGQGELECCRPLDASCSHWASPSGSAQAGSGAWLLISVLFTVPCREL